MEEKNMQQLEGKIKLNFPLYRQPGHKYDKSVFVDLDKISNARFVKPTQSGSLIVYGENYKGDMGVVAELPHYNGATQIVVKYPGMHSGLYNEPWDKWGPLLIEIDEQGMKKEYLCVPEGYEWVN